MKILKVLRCWLLSKQPVLKNVSFAKEQMYRIPAALPSISICAPSARSALRSFFVPEVDLRYA